MSPLRVIQHLKRPYSSPGNRARLRLSRLHPIRIRTSIGARRCRADSNPTRPGWGSIRQRTQGGV